MVTVTDFCQMRDAIDKILYRVCHSTRPHDLLSVKIAKYVKRFSGKLAKTMSPMSAQLVEYTICKLVKDANTAQSRETMCKLLAQLYLWSPDSEQHVGSWLSRNFWGWELSSNQHVVRAMLQNKVIPVSRLDSLISSRVDKFNTTQSITSVATLVCDLIAGYPRVAKLEDFTTTLDMLRRVCTAPTDHIPHSLIAISSQLNSTQQNAASEDDVMRSVFEVWTELIAMEPRSKVQETDFLRTLILRGMFDETRNLDTFFRSALGYCLQLCCDGNELASESIRQKGYKAVCGLATLVIRAYEFSELGDIGSRLCIVNHIFANLLAFVMHVCQTSEVNGDVNDKFDGRPYYYFFMHTLLLLHDSTELDCEAKRGMYIYLADCFHFIRPTECILFVVLWTKLVSDEHLFVKHMLEDEESTGMLVELLCSGMEFIGKYLNVRSMYVSVQDVDIMLQNVFVNLAKIRPDFIAAHKGRFTNAVHERQDYDDDNGVDDDDDDDDEVMETSSNVLS
ncbi:uncharacterized protein V1513DRAFT_382614 [Lipomyces chichibuensis]|uniref:uncharacterized protein n=1 Tax=Lipomyces chichibuensis TaxID=1546026 RepID=UPI003343E1AC